MNSPANLAQLIASGHIVDLILGLLLLEAGILLAIRLKSSRGLAAWDIVLALAPGALLLLALRSALIGKPWVFVAVALAASFPVHLLDLARRWHKEPIR